ncbi:MAG TPA: XrtA system polysaccharide chain length determinant [Solirubrobacteraceae bacterium]|nr:XrtA system polysaccharide chain length determinant [Solirubrobacteraceae bacterium]
MDRKLIFFYLQGIWRRKWVAAGICWLVCVIGWPAVFRIPNIYESSARVYVDVDSLLTPLLRGIAVETNPLQQLDYMQRTLLSRPNLEQVIHLADIDAQARTPEAKEALLTGLARDVHVGLQGDNLFDIAYQDADPVEAKNVVKAVLTVFSEASAGNNRADMDNARRFLEEQIASYEKQLRAAEARRAQFRETYGSILPDANVPRLEQARDQVEKLQLQLDDSQARRGSIAKEMATTPQFLTVDQAASIIISNGGPQASPKQVELDDDERKLADLKSRYTDDYPDVVALQRDIASLKSQLDQGAKGAKAAGPDAARRGQVPNPVYDQLKLRLVDVDSNLASIQRQLDFAKADEQHVAAAVKAAPGIDLQAQNLDRDYDVLKKNYQELVARREAANMAQAADTQADKVQFRIVDAPQVPLLPISPDRPILYSAVLVAGLAAGLGAAFLLVQLDRSFSTLASLRSFGLPVLGSISRVNLFGTRRRAIQQATGLAASVFALLMIYGALLLANYTAIHRVI